MTDQSEPDRIIGTVTKNSRESEGVALRADAIPELIGLLQRAHARRGRPDGAPMANRKVNATGRTERTERHVRLTHFLLNSAAYGSLGPAPRALLVEVLKRYTGFNNGSIGLGVREAAAALHVKPQTIGRAFTALQDRGFVAMTRGSSFHQKKLTSEWRVTFLPVGDFQSPTPGADPRLRALAGRR